MKKTTLIKTMLLLCALVAGSSSVWAIDVTAVLTGSAWTKYAVTGDNSYKDFNNPIFDNLGFGYTGRWAHANPSKKPCYEMIQLGALSNTNTSHLTLPKYDGKIKSITLAVTNSSGTSKDASGKEAKVKMHIVNGSAYTKTDINTNGILEVDHSTDETKSFEIVFDFTGKSYDGEGLYICSSSGSLRIWEMEVVYEVTNYPVTITNVSGFATLYSRYALDFSGLNSELKAYTATVSSSSVTLTQIDNIPANTGVVLKGDVKTHNVPVIVSSSTAKGNLTGNIAESTAYDAFTGYDLYMLALNGAGKAQFTKVNDGSIAAGKAFLKLESGSGARELSVVFDDDETTAIRGIENGEMKVKNSFFDLQGRRVAQPTKGLYIVNGKKVVIK